jgi:hypothetical protein
MPVSVNPRKKLKNRRKEPARQCFCPIELTGCTEIRLSIAPENGYPTAGDVSANLTAELRPEAMLMAYSAEFSHRTGQC